MKYFLRKYSLSKLFTAPLVYIIISFIRFDITWIPEYIIELSQMDRDNRSLVVFGYFSYEIFYLIIFCSIYEKKIKKHLNEEGKVTTQA